MEEIFIPTDFQKSQKINTISWEFLELCKHFETCEITEFSSSFLNGITLKFTWNIPQDCVSICNGEFWGFYFIERKFLQNKIHSSGSTILGDSSIFDSIPDISTDIMNIIEQLQSKKLLTRSAMEAINGKITKICFTLSWIIYTLESMKQISSENEEELKSYDGAIEYTSQAELLGKVSKSKREDIERNLEQLYPKIEIFLDCINKIN